MGIVSANLPDYKNLVKLHFLTKREDISFEKNISFTALFNLVMRLGIVLCRWPKFRPAGNIWAGKNQMVRKVWPHHKRQIQEDIDREKKNIFLCMNPAASVEQERILYEELEKEEDSKSLLSKLNKAGAENTTFAPIPLNNHYETLNRTGTWQKY